VHDELQHDEHQREQQHDEAVTKHEQVGDEEDDATRTVSMSRRVQRDITSIVATIGLASLSPCVTDHGH
jgi:hypothetical protein